MQLLDITDCRVTFAGVDLIDGTPVIDLKPFVGRFDQPPGDPACGWFDHITITEGVTPAALTARRLSPGEASRVEIGVDGPSAPDPPIDADPTPLV